MIELELSFASKDDSLTVRTFSIREEMNALWEVDIIARSKLEELDLASFVGKGAAFTARADPLNPASTTRIYNGFVAQMDQTRAEVAGLSTYYIKIVPAFWRATLRKNSRIFQHINIPDIVSKVLGEWKITPELRIQAGRYPKLEYRVQYQETDYAFISRLLEEAGIAFFFTHDAGGKTPDQQTRLVLSDDSQNAASIATVPFMDNPGKALDQTFVTAVRLAQRALPGHHSIRDYDFRQKPDYQLIQDFQVKTVDGEEKYEQYDYTPGAFLIEPGKGGDTPVADDKGIARVDEKFGKALAQKRLEADRRDRLIVTLNSNRNDLTPGTVFQIKDHPRKDINRNLLVTSTVMEGGDGLAWSVHVETVYCDVQYRPILRTAKPRVIGVQSAMVVGPHGEEIHTDEFGRIRVQFHWDREGKFDDYSTCWMRVSQGWAGFSYGMILIPRVGHEVLVDFFEGDPDQPVVVGRVFNNTTRVPYKLPENKTKSGWKSDTSPGSNGFNEISFEDAKGKEVIFIQAQKDFTEIIKNNQSSTVLANRSANVTKNDSMTVGQNQSFDVDANQSHTVGGNQSNNIVKSRTSIIGENDSVEAGTSHSVHVAGGTGITITDGRIVLTTGGASIILEGGSVVVTGNAGIGVVAGALMRVCGQMVVVDGGPQVQINCQGAIPPMPIPVQKVSTPSKPGAPSSGGEVSTAAPLLSGHGKVDPPMGFDEATVSEPAMAPKKMALGTDAAGKLNEALKENGPTQTVANAKRALLTKDNVTKALEIAKIGKDAIKTKGKSLLQVDQVKKEIGHLVTQPILGKITGKDIADVLNTGQQLGILKLGKKTDSVVQYIEGAAGDAPNKVESVIGKVLNKPLIGDISIGDLAGAASQGQDAGLWKLGGKGTKIVTGVKDIAGKAADAAKTAKDATGAATDATGAAKDATGAATEAGADQTDASMMVMRTGASPEHIDGALIDDHVAEYKKLGWGEGPALNKALSHQGIAMYAGNAAGNFTKIDPPA